MVVGSDTLSIFDPEPKRLAAIPVPPSTQTACPTKVELLPSAMDMPFICISQYSAYPSFWSHQWPPVVHGCGFALGPDLPALDQIWHGK